MLVIWYVIMSHAAESPNPLSVLRESINARRAELDKLYDMFGSGLEIVRDLGSVNLRLAEVGRPDLFMSERLEIPLPDSPEQLGPLNNFCPNLDTFGEQVYGLKEVYPGRSERRLLGYRPFGEETTAKLKVLTGAGDYAPYMETAKNVGLDTDLASNLWTATSIGHEFFARFWLVLPELSSLILDHCLERRRPGHHNSSERNINEEHYAAYVLMAHLVDVNDRYVNKEGTLDQYILTR